MRKIAAQYIYPIDKKPIRYGILTIDDNGTILDVSQGDENLQEGESTEFYNGIIVPGFVNAHCHSELSHMLSILSKGGGMSTFCSEIMQNRNHVSKESQERAAALGSQLMHSEGIVAVGDISNSTTSFAAKAKSPVYYHTFVECLGLKADAVDAILTNAKNVLAEAQTMGLRASITPHAPYSMSEELFAKSVELANQQGILSIHNQESNDEMELFKNGNGLLSDVFIKQGLGFDEAIEKYSNPINRILQYVAHNISLLLIHNVYTTADDYERAIAINPNTTWVLCPNSNIYIENKLPPADMFCNKGANVALGTDSLSSNTRLSILEELKTLNFNFPDISLETLLQWATMGGAKALRIDDKFGSLTEGKCPGIVLIDGIDFDKMKLTDHSRAFNMLL